MRKDDEVSSQGSVVDFSDSTDELTKSETLNIVRYSNKEEKK